MSDENAMTETEQVEILAEPTPGLVAAWRDEHMPERRIYGESGYASLVPDNMFEGADMPAEKRQAAVKELRGMLADTGLAPAEASGLLNRAGHVRVEAKPVEQMRREARALLSKEFDDPDQALADARKLIARDQRFSKFIERKGLGNDGQTIVMLARAARSQRMAGKLK